MAGRLTKEDRRTLSYLAKQHGLIWGGVYERGGDADLFVLQQRGLIEAIAQPYTVGRMRYSGGYRITIAGRKALTPEDSSHG